MKNLLSKRGFEIFVLLSLLSFFIFIRLLDVGAIERFRFTTFDYYNKVFPRSPAEGVVIIDIDEESLKKYGQWPWSRDIVAKIPKKLNEMGAAATVFDIVFSEQDRTSPNIIADKLPDEMKDLKLLLNNMPDNDDLFASEIKKAGNVVTAFVGAREGDRKRPVSKAIIRQIGEDPDAFQFLLEIKNFATNLKKLSKSAAGNGSFIMKTGFDGVIRKIPMLIGYDTGTGGSLGKRIYPALALEALRVAQNKRIIEVENYGAKSKKANGIKSIRVGDYKIPTDKNGNFWVYYTGHRQSLYVPAWKLLEEDFDKDRFKDKIVLIGTSAIGLLDLRSSPLDPVLPGVEVHAEILEQVLTNDYIQRLPYADGLELIATIFIALFIIIIASFITTFTLSVFVTVILSSCIFAALYFYNIYGLLFDPVYPGLVIISTFIMSSILNNLRTEHEKAAINNAFGHYVSKDLMSELTSNPDRLKLGGEVRELSIMFTDVRNFTTISEQMDPEELIQVMNDFLTPMTSLIMENRGTIDKYMGDAIMAFWNAPLDDDNHANHACSAALKMAEILQPINDELKIKAEASNRKYHEIRTGIGISTGDCSVGNMGSRQRFAYSALGDSVNLGSRLEGQTKEYGVDILISEETYKQISGFAALELDLLTVKGRVEPTRIYTIIGNEEYLGTTEFTELKDQHDKMINLYRDQDFKKALRLSDKLQKILNGKYQILYQMYSTRIKEYIETPPAKDWQGEWIAKSK